MRVGRASSSDDGAAWLSVEELAVLRSRGTARRIADRIVGRIAAKRALSGLTGVGPLSITIASAESGEPIATVPGYRDARVSISHRNGKGVAVGVLHGRVGVDLEVIAQRPDSFVSDWYSPDEQVWCQGDPRRQTIAWCAKEAVLKLVGKGMALAPRDVETIGLVDDTLIVRVFGGVQDALNDLDSGVLTLVWSQESSDEIMVTARRVPCYPTWHVPKDEG